MARTPTPINYDQIQKLASLGCTEEEMAGFIGFTKEGFRKRKLADEELANAVETGKMQGKLSLRRTQFKLALGETEQLIGKDGKGVVGPDGRPVMVTVAKPCKTMLIWLGKQMLGQRDRFDHAHGGGGGDGPIQYDELTNLSENERQRRIEELYARRPTEDISGEI